MNESEQALPFIELRRFSRDDEELYRTYLKLKYEVFVAEQGWYSLADESATGLAREEEFDAHGRLWLASTEDLVPVGIVRGTPLKEGFPRRQLLEHHLQRPEVATMVAALCTINGLAVRASYRRHRYRVRGRGWTGTIGRLLMLAVVHDLEAQGMEATVATAGGPISARLCESLGFIVIDPPQKTPLHPELFMINVGLVFGSPQHLRAQVECEMRQDADGRLGAQARQLLVYFEEQRANVLGVRRLLEEPKGRQPCGSPEVCSPPKVPKLHL